MNPVMQNKFEQTLKDHAMPIKAILACAVLSFAFCGTSFALTDAEYLSLKKASPEFAQSEKELNSTWKALMARVPNETAKKALVKEQRQWLKERDAEAGRLMASGKSLGAAYATANYNRVNVLKQMTPASGASEQTACGKIQNLFVRPDGGGGAMWMGYELVNGNKSTVIIPNGNQRAIRQMDSFKFKEDDYVCVTGTIHNSEVDVEKKFTLFYPQKQSKVSNPGKAKANIFAAAKKGDLEAVKDALASGAKVNAKNKEGYTALLLAAEKGHAPVVKELIRAGADVESAICDEADDCDTPLTLAAKNNHVETAKALIAAGADVNVSSGYDVTPLWSTDNAEIARALIAAGAEVYVGHEAGIVIIHYAAMDGNSEKVKALVEGGANVNQKDVSDCTPLHYAAKEGKLDTVKTLLSLGAKINARDTGGMTPLDMAVENGHKRTADFLRSKGAKSGSR